MQFASFLIENRPTWGIVQDDRLISSNRAAEFSTLRDYLTAGRPKVDWFVDDAVAIEDVQFLPVIPNPTKIICIGLNYRSHILEMGRKLPEFPTLFGKFANALIGHRQPIAYSDASNTLDYEAELAVVIGRPARNVSVNEAFKYVAGYTVFNDISVREYQRRTSQWLQGKSFEQTTPVGPFLVTLDEIANPLNVALSLTVNGELRQQANTIELVHNVPDLVAYISAFTTLEPGDIIATGTPAGVGIAREPSHFLRPGDKIVTEISGVGRLENRVLEFPQTSGHRKK